MARIHRTVFPLLLGGLSLLSGCVTTEDINAGVLTLEGKPYQYAFDRIGYPDMERKIAGKTVFTWVNRESGTYTVPDTETATAMVDGHFITTEIQTTRLESYNYHCKLDLIVNASGIVERAESEGNLQGCQRYAALAPKKKKK